jgi:hypothetical protein
VIARRRAEAEAEAQLVWVRRRAELQAVVAAAERVRGELSIRGPGALSPEELERVQKAAYLAGAEMLLEDAKAALAVHVTPSMGGYRG